MSRTPEETGSRIHGGGFAPRVAGSPRPLRGAMRARREDRRPLGLPALERWCAALAPAMRTVACRGMRQARFRSRRLGIRGAIIARAGDTTTVWTWNSPSQDTLGVPVGHNAPPAQSPGATLTSVSPTGGYGPSPGASSGWNARCHEEIRHGAIFDGNFSSGSPLQNMRDSRPLHAHPHVFLPKAPSSLPLQVRPPVGWRVAESPVMGTLQDRSSPSRPMPRS
jgi:hypothetical protein